MSKIRKYGEFISEELFNLFKGEKEQKKLDRDSRIESCVDDMISFLIDNQIENWNDFMLMSNFDREVVDQLIDESIENMDELSEVRFEIRLRLSDRSQLKEMLKEYEELEKYEKCDKILKKMKNI